MFNICLETNELINTFEFFKNSLEDIYWGNYINEFKLFIIESNNKKEIILFRDYNKILKFFKIKENDFIKRQK